MPAPSHERLARQLRDGARGGVFFLYGDEDHLKETAARAIIAAHLEPGTRDFNLDEVRGGEVTAETLGSLIQTPPMMAEWRVVVVRDAQGLAVSSAARAILEDVVKAPPPGLALVLVADIGGSKARLWDRLKKDAASAEFGRLPDADLPGWLMARAGEVGLRLEPEAARALATAIGADLATLVREMEKLRDYVGDRPAITRADVEAVVGAIPRQDRWEWMDLVAERRFDRARAALPILLEAGENGVGLVIGLGAHFLRLGLCVEGGRPALENALPRHQRWLGRRIEAQARRWSPPAIARAVEDLRRADWLLKSAPLSDLQVMEELLLRLEHAREAAA
ncbi:MAG TPA: DNA polymerase III subunit delta [Longimicrobiales bacterium]|nr:DNA polymerase III subunit delta [Longimicrobiales bacterium]